MDYKYNEFSNYEKLTDYGAQYDRELEAMLSDTARDLNDLPAKDSEDAKVLRREILPPGELERMGESAIAQNMEALRDDYEDKGLSDMEISAAIASDYESAREEFYSDLNEGLDLDEH